MASKTAETSEAPDLPFDEAAVTIVLLAMEEGNSLRQACEIADTAPSTFIRWVNSDAQLAEHYTRARETLLDLKAEDLELLGEKAATAKSNVEVSGLRVQIDTRKWVLSKLSPKKYGDRITHQGDDEAPPIQVETTQLTMTQRAARMASLAALAARRGAP